MATEIEKKFLIQNDDWRGIVEGKAYAQGYLSTETNQTVRVRTIGTIGFLTIKSKTIGETRLEFEYEIPIEDANEMLEELCGKPLISKIRYKIPFEGFVWEVDEFSGENDGLIFAEIELHHEGETFDKPHWIGDEVTGDPRYYNSNLIKNPFKNWPSFAGHAKSEK